MVRLIHLGSLLLHQVQGRRARQRVYKIAISNLDVEYNGNMLRTRNVA